ncbi:MAG TPA: hypothetical protein VKT51_02220 [Candidatus Eremiobacteraceae bacterium]|nr:hypothetical protein [Candidatus Eremiobacteraceae bacterium]
MKHVIRHSAMAIATSAAIAAMGASSTASQPLDHLEIFSAEAAGSSAPVQTIDFSVAVRDVAVNSRGEIIVTDPAADRVLIFASNASGAAKPAASIGGVSSTILSPSAIAFDSRGELLVANEGRQGEGASVAVFAPKARGDIAPARRIAGPATSLSDPVAVAVDSRDEMYVIDAAARDVLVFAPGASGNQAPARRLAIAGYTARELAIGADDQVYVFASDGPRGMEEIASFPHGSDTQAHAPLTGSGVNGANWISVDRAGLLHVLSPGRIYTFAPEASGDARPASVLNVDFFLSNCCARMTAGADGRLYVYLTAFHWSA